MRKVIFGSVVVAVVLVVGCVYAVRAFVAGLGL